MMREEYLNYDQAADYIGIAAISLRQKVSGRKIPYLKVGKRVLFRKADIDRWLAKHLVREIA
jgi:excisionase family DNA binding protein